MMKLTDDERNKLLEIQPEDSDDIKGLKTYMQMVYDLTPEERVIFYQEERVTQEEHRLQYMIEENQRDEAFAQRFIRDAELYMDNYTTLGEPGEETSEGWLQTAELCAEIAKGTRANRYTMGDIRKQREKVQWERRKLNKMTKPPTEPSQS